MLPSVWQGKLVRLREIEPEDWRIYAAWNLDDEQSRNLDKLYFPMSDARMRAWAEKEATKERDGDNRRLVIVSNNTGEIVGDIGTHDCDPIVGNLSYGIAIRADHRRKGYAGEAIRLLLRFYFTERRYQKATVSAFEFNDASIALHEGLGFQREGRLRRTVYSSGRYWDEIMFGITVEEFLERYRQEIG